MADMFDIKVIAEAAGSLSEAALKGMAPMAHEMEALISQIDQQAASAAAAVHIGDIIEGQADHTLSESTHESQEHDTNAPADNTTVAVHATHDAHDVGSDGTEA